MTNDPMAYLSKVVKSGGSKAADRPVRVKVKEHERGRPSTRSGEGALGALANTSATDEKANIEGNESKKYEGLEKKSLRALKGGGTEQELRAGHNSGAGSYKGKSLAPGGGGAFAKQKDAIMRTGKSAESAAAITAVSGRKKYGAKTFAAMGAAGRKRAAKAKV
jgi:hypothetical protein